MREKLCSKCGKSKKVSEFYKHPSTKDGRQSWCKPCYRDRPRKLAAEDRKPVTRKLGVVPRNGKRLTNRERHLVYDLGISLDCYEKMFAAQGGKCAICKTDKPQHRHGLMCVDHDHSTGAVRGLLCHPCNMMLGWSKDDVSRLRSAATYLETCTRID